MVEIITSEKEQVLTVHLPAPDTLWVLNDRGLEIIRFEQTDHFELYLESLPNGQYFVYTASGFSARFRKKS